MEKPKSHRTTKDKFRSPIAGKRPQKASLISKFRLNLKDPEKPVQKNKPKTGKSGAKLQFRLGGDSSDPLNLNSLINRDPSEVTPQCSPYVDRQKDQSPRVVIQPKDITDPLNLKCDFYEDLKGFVVVTPTRKKRKRKRNDSVCYNEDRENENNGDTGQNKEYVSPKIKKKKKIHHGKDPKKKNKDEKDGCKKEKKKHGKENNKKSNKESNKGMEKMPKKKEVLEKEETMEMPIDLDVGTEIGDKKSKENTVEPFNEQELEQQSPVSVHKENMEQTSSPKIRPMDTSSGSKTKKTQKSFVYGNYNRYYGYRNPSLPNDPRLKLFKADWFKSKSVLDIGCNIGNVTLQVAREFEPKRVLGIDIDSSLIKTANKFLRCAIQEHKTKKFADFPMSFAVCRGPIISSGCSAQEKNVFPYNVEFKEENFVLQNDASLVKQKPTYDVILCLSLTKWIHLNWGDEGLKRAFKRMFLMLHPGGRLLLEAQPFKSYSKRKNLSEKIRQNYDAIHFLPNQFVDYLMSEEVGFASYEALGVSPNSSKGFQRPLYLFTKSVSEECYDALGVDISENRTKTSNASHSFFD